MNELALFAGVGGGILGGHLLGWQCVCAVEYDEYARNVLLARQRDGCLPKFPIWDDVRTFNGKSWRGMVDVVSGGFPCQDISAAGKGAGIEGSRSGLWKEMARIIGEVRPRYAFVENSPLLIRRGLTTVLSDLAEMGYDAAWGIVSAADCGAWHQRKRLWCIAWNTDSNDASLQRKVSQRSDTESSRSCDVSNPRCKLWQAGSVSESSSDSQAIWGTETKEPERCSKDVADAASQRRGEARQDCEQSSQWTSGKSDVFNPLCSRLEGQRQESSGASKEQRDTSDTSWWAVEPNVGRVAHGVAHRVDRLRCIGNGQVPIVAATAWRRLITLSGTLEVL